MFNIGFLAFKLGRLTFQKLYKQYITHHFVPIIITKYEYTRVIVDVELQSAVEGLDSFVRVSRHHIS